MKSFSDSPHPPFAAIHPNAESLSSSDIDRNIKQEQNIGDLRLHRPFAKEVFNKLKKFIEEEVAPGEVEFGKQLYAAERGVKGGYDVKWRTHCSVIDDLKKKAKEAGLWNLFLPSVSGLTNVEYGYCAELMGRYLVASEACNCSAPDTGNMEVLEKYGDADQKKKWLGSLLNGDIRSVFLMTETNVASSDATNIECEIREDGPDHYLISGRKWWSSGACDPRCKVAILMGRVTDSSGKPKSDKTHLSQSMVVFPLDLPGVNILRPLHVFGYDDAPHGHAEVLLENVRIKKSEGMLLGEGRGFEIAQGRLGAGRIHHCMRSIGLAERSMEAMIRRGMERVAFKRPILSMNPEVIAESRIEIDQLRLLVLAAASKLDVYDEKYGEAHRNKTEKTADQKLLLADMRRYLSMIKYIVPKTVCKIVDRAMQMHGGMGVSQDTFLPYAYALQRTLRIADGPDEVHRALTAKLEVKRYAKM